MKMEDLKMRKVKASARSITCKNDDGKTCGLVHAVRFTDLPFREQFDLSPKLNASGIWGTGKANLVYAVGKELYYLHNMLSIEHYEKYIANREGYEYDKKHYGQMKALAESAAKYMKVIPCYIL